MGLLISIVRAVTAIIVALIVVGIVLVLLDAKESNGLVAAVLDGARFFTDPFRGIIDLEKGKEKEQIAINWGIAAVVYGLVGGLLASLLARAGRRG